MSHTEKLFWLSIVGGVLFAVLAGCWWGKVRVVQEAVLYALAAVLLVWHYVKKWLPFLILVFLAALVARFAWGLV